MAGGEVRNYFGNINRHCFTHLEKDKNFLLPKCNFPNTM